MTSNFVNFLLKIQGSKLICESVHHSVIGSNLTVVIDGKIYSVVYETANSVHDLSIGKICEFFQNGFPCQVQLSLNYGQESMSGFICFDNIPQKLPFSCGSFFEQNQPLVFKLRLCNKDYIDIRFAKQSDRNVLSFALGCFKYLDLFIEFRSMIFFSDEYRIPVIWKMFIRFLREIGYFDIFKINHFQSFVLPMFLRMISFVNKKSDRRNLLLSFIKKFLSDNCWFMIIGGKYRAILGRSSSKLIELFSDPLFPPIANFVNYEFDCVGLITTPTLECKLVSISTTQVIDVGPLTYEEEEKEPSCVIDPILSELFRHDVDLDDFPELLRRRPAGVDMSCIPDGVVRVYGDRFILFIFKMRNYINFFIQRPDGRFECFCPYFFMMLHMFSDNDRLMNQLKNQFENFSSIDASILVDALVRNCGFESIFDRTATPEQFRMFLFESEFGRLLQQLIHDFVSFPERLLEHCSKEDENEYRQYGSRLLSSSLFGRKDVEEREKQCRIKEKYCSRIEFLQKNQYISHLRRIFEMILERLQVRADLSQEFQQTLSSLEQVVKFLTIPPDSE